MQVLILYGSKTGTTETCAMKIKEEMQGHDVTVVNLKKRFKGELSNYDAVIVGTPLYMGKMSHHVERFYHEYGQAILNSKLHLFVCGLARGEEGVELLKKQVPPKIFEHATQARQLGGDVHVDRLNPIYKFIMNKILAESKPELGLLDEEIKTFASNIH